MPANQVQGGLHLRTVAVGHMSCIEVAGGHTLGPEEHQSLAGLGSHRTKAVRRIDHLADLGASSLAAAEDHRNRNHLAAGPGMREYSVAGVGNGPVVRGMGTARTPRVAVEADMKVSAVRTVYGRLRCHMEHSVGLKMKVAAVDCAVDQSFRRRLALSDHMMEPERKVHTERNHDGSGQHCLQWVCSLQWCYAERSIVGLVADKLLVELRQNNHYCAGRSMSNRSYCSNSVGLS